jgi:2,4-dienoyl-CoA reductase-like NADH-dependent reductase (Old Yellow Enzyme family)
MTTIDALDALWSPLAIGGASASNRIALAAHTTGFRGAQYAAYLGARARGGAGLIITGASPVHPAVASSVIWNAHAADSVAEMRLTVDAVHAAGSIVFIQLGHAGVHAGGSATLEEWGLALGPSGVPSPTTGLVPKVMEQQDIDEVVEGFGLSAKHCQQAGADGVELHAAHGFLLSEFLSPTSNRRSDAYGGDAERRARLLIDIGEGVRARCGRDFVVGVKLNVDDFVAGRGISPAEALATIRVLHERRLFDYFSLSAANYESFHYMIAPETSGLGGHLAVHGPAAREASAYEVPVMVTGRIRSLELAARIIEAGQADLVGMIRAQIADPDLVRKGRAGEAEQIRRCVGANQGCWRRVAQGGQLSCTVNPVTGREWLWRSDDRTARPRRVLVVGGGPAGMKLAATAAARGHSVTLMEREGELGGQIRHAAELPQRSSWGHVIEDLKGALARLAVEIKLDSELSAHAAADFAADMIYLATGAVWDTSGVSATRPGLEPDLDREGCEIVDPVAALGRIETLGRRVVIVDDNGDYLPLGLAEKIAHTGRGVTIATPHLAVGGRLGSDATVDFAWIYPRLLACGVEIVTAHHLTHVGAGHVGLVSAWGEARMEIEADAVVLCMTRRSDDALYSELRSAGLEVRRIGDCVAPREADHAIFDGLREGLAL